MRPSRVSIALEILTGDVLLLPVHNFDHEKHERRERRGGLVSHPFRKFRAFRGSCPNSMRLKQLVAHRLGFRDPRIGRRGALETLVGGVSLLPVNSPSP